MADYTGVFERVEQKYLLVFCWIIGWGLEYRKRQKSDEETV